MNMPKRERRDWGLIIFIIPIGIFLIVIVGQLAIGLFPNWRINADMSSNLDPNSVPGQPASLLQPLLPQILTPMAWAESYLTPGADISFPPFFVIEPTSTASPSPTPVSPTPTTVTPTATTPSPTTTFTATSTPNPTDDNTPTATSTATATSTTTATSTATGTATGTASPTGYPSTPDPSWTQLSPVPTGIGATPGPPDNNPPGSMGGLAIINQNNYIVINFSVVVESTPDANYDLVLYEFNSFGYVYIDWMIIGISNDPSGATYYEVFNWGDGSPDTNTNVGDVSGTEGDDQQTDLSEFHDPDGGSNDNQTGILIDVDNNATSEPPPNTYNYIVVIAPNGGGSLEVDALDVTEVPIATP